MDYINPLIDVRKGWSANFEQGSLNEFLAEKRNNLDKIVFPWISTKRVTDRTTGQVILFRGKLRTLKKPDPAQLLLRNYCAIAALQFLYALEQAMVAKDIDRAVEAMAGFMAMDVEVTSYDRFKTYPIEALMRTQRRTAGSAKGGKATAKWKPEIAKPARKIFDEVKRSNSKISDEAAYQRTRARLAKEHGTTVSVSTLRRHLSAQR